MKKNIILLLILVIFIFGCVQEPIACTEDAKVCPDGSAVGRDPNNNCEFFSCPEIEDCTKKDTGEKLSLVEAKQIALNSECGDRLKEPYMCNADTGTWWIDLDIEKEMCNPACVVNVVTKTAEINWRCTGALLPE